MSRRFLILPLLWLLVACGQPQPGQPQPGQPRPLGLVRLSRLEPLPASPDPAIKPLRVAVAAIVSPQGTVETYTPLLDYLSQRLGRPVELVQRRTYAEVNDLLRQGGVDVAFVCTSAYVVGQREFGMQLLAAPRVRGETVYYSWLIVPASSPAQSMADLRGKVFAFTDPISNTGRNYPVWLVQQLGAQPESFFARTFYTYSHDDAIQAVAAGVADGAAVDSLVYQFALERDPSLAGQVKVIQRSPPFGMPPVVVGPQMRPSSGPNCRQCSWKWTPTPRDGRPWPMPASTASPWPATANTNLCAF